MIACLQATILVAGQVSNLSDPVLNADPLFGVTGQLAHTPYPRYVADVCILHVAGTSFHSICLMMMPA
jgi:hypothetical protein